MLRVVTYVLALTMIGSASWAQTNMTPVPSTFARKAVAQVISRLGQAAPSALASPTANNGLPYNGGPILDDANGVNVYFIWYGDWSHDRLAQKVLLNFITHIGGSPYFNINTTYFSLDTAANGTKVVRDPVVNAVHYLGSTSDAYSQGANLTDDQVYLAVANAITSGALPADPNGVYFLLTSADVNEGTDFCTVYCAWHTSSTFGALPLVNGIDIKFAWVGNAASICPYNCIYNFQTSISGSMGADGMANMVAHELEESTTDPDGTSWIDLTNANVGENADLCAWVFPGPYHFGSATDPQPPDMKLGGVPYLIQENWVNAKGGYCAIRWDP